MLWAQPVRSALQLGIPSSLRSITALKALPAEMVIAKQWSKCFFCHRTVVFVRKRLALCEPDKRPSNITVRIVTCSASSIRTIRISAFCKTWIYFQNNVETFHSSIQTVPLNTKLVDEKSLRAPSHLPTAGMVTVYFCCRHLRFPAAVRWRSAASVQHIARLLRFRPISVRSVLDRVYRFVLVVMLHLLASIPWMRAF